MYGIFVNEDGGVRYAQAIVQRIKPVETRTRNVFKRIVGERVAIIRTRRNKKPTIVGYADITLATPLSREWLSANRDKTLIPPGSSYDCKSAYKWCYFLADAEECEPYELPKNAIRHGRSYAEF